MGFTPYLTHALLPSDADLNVVPQRLVAEVGARAELRLVAGRPHIYFGSYGFFLGQNFDLDHDSDVREEMQRALATIGTTEEQRREYSSLLSYGGLDLDPDMDHFNDSLYIAQAVETLFPGTILYDPQSGQRI